MLIPVSLYVVKNILVTKIIKTVHNVWHVLTFSMESMLRIVFKRCRPHDEYLSVIAWLIYFQLTTITNAKSSLVNLENDLGQLHKSFIDFEIGLKQLYNSLRLISIWNRLLWNKNIKIWFGDIYIIYHFPYFYLNTQWKRGQRKPDTHLP